MTKIGTILHQKYAFQCHFRFCYSVFMMFVDTMDMLKVKETHDRVPKHDIFTLECHRNQYKQ